MYILASRKSTPIDFFYSIEKGFVNRLLGRELITLFQKLHIFHVMSHSVCYKDLINFYGKLVVVLTFPHCVLQNIIKSWKIN